jgi:hypothetical protein
MRLTLRTLLAYLDNTLEPKEAELLRQKVEQSGFATQLIQQIHRSLADPNISAPAPESVHPIAEPNMMSDYLDSTLGPEQIAEIEKACLESLPHLAEAAACHQILTLVLGRKAEVSEDLRKQIHAMVDPSGQINTSATAETSAGLFGGNAGSTPIAGGIGPRLSNATVPDAETIVSADQVGGAPFSSSSPEPPPAEPFSNIEVPPASVQPVGVSDSGVFQAATKLREQSEQFAATGTEFDQTSHLSSERTQRRLKRSDFYDGERRSSRLLPWGVSAALAVALVFVLTQIFSPLLNEEVAYKDGADDKPAAASSTDEDPESATGQLSRSGEVEDDSSKPDEDSADEDSADEDSTGDDGADGMGTDNEDSDAVASGSAGIESAGAESEAAVDANRADQTASPAQNPKSDTENRDRPEMQTTAEAPSAPADGDDLIAETPGDDSAAGTADAKVAMAADDASDVSVAEPKPVKSKPVKSKTGGSKTAMKATAAAPDLESAAADDKETPAPLVVEPAAKLVSEDVLVAGAAPDQDWKLIEPNAEIVAGRPLVCAPAYRADFAALSNEEVGFTLVGPARLQLTDSDRTLGMNLEFGRSIIRMVEPGDQLSLQTDALELVGTAESAGAILAVEVSPKRELGTDPMVAENLSTEVQLTSMLGDWSIAGTDAPKTLGQGQQITITLDADQMVVGEVIMLDMPVPWVDPETDTGSLEASAASDLLELVRTDNSPSLVLSLHVALDFRRNEVAALAGQTLLALGDASGYFGVDGLLHNPKQRLYWSEHLTAIRSMMDRSPEAAARVRTAIAGQNETMDDANGDTLFRLLIGYSQEQLSSGGDAELVEALESASMPVRVLASENLRQISGTTLFFRPEEMVASRRDEVVKKWKVRLRKESIRWPEEE